MMSKYVVNVEPLEDGSFKVHTDWCEEVPDALNQVFLGHFETCWAAIKQAHALDITAGACFLCCKECHVG